MKIVVHWFRRDLRLTDNPALTAAAATGAEVIPVYVVSDWRGGSRWTGPHRQQFLCDSLRSLAANLRSMGSTLVIRRGEAVSELIRLLRENRAEGLFFNRAPDRFGRRVEEQLQALAKEMGISVWEGKDVCLHERDEVLTAAGTPFRKFTSYAQAWSRLAKEAPGRRIPRFRTPPGLTSLPLPDLDDWGLVRAGTPLEGGERAARTRFTRFLDRGLASYGDQRDLLAAEATSRLGPDLRWGLVSIREVYSRVRDRLEAFPLRERRNAEKFVQELMWREFFMNILWHFPEVLECEFQPKFRSLAWPGREEHFARWCAGETGFPIVDAAMRELNQTGYMPNRARMITAMFLTKDLHVDWRRGEAYFLQALTDGEIASNNGGWQWCAGTGADGAPYFRIQNPWTQTQRYDPQGAFIKKWLPELRDVAPEKLARPPTEKLARNYPLPIVDHAEARRRTLALFGAAQDGGRSAKAREEF